jgi:hypothetical protein
VIARRTKSMFTPANVVEVRRRFQSILKKAAQRAEAVAAQHRATPLRPSVFQTTRQRKTA